MDDLRLLLTARVDQDPPALDPDDVMGGGGGSRLFTSLPGYRCHNSRSTPHRFLFPPPSPPPPHTHAQVSRCSVASSFPLAPLPPHPAYPVHSTKHKCNLYGKTNTGAGKRRKFKPLQGLVRRVGSWPTTEKKNNNNKFQSEYYNESTERKDESRTTKNFVPPIAKYRFSAGTYSKIFR
jgi:hypothetical protein